MSRFSGLLATAAVTLGAAVSAVQFSIYDVDAGQRAIIYHRLHGVQDHVIGEGTHFRVPYLEQPTVFDVRIRPRSVATMTGTKDMQMVNITLRILSKPEVAHLPWIYRRLGIDYDERILPSIVNETLKAVVAQYNAEQLLTMREKVSRQIRDALTMRAAEFKIALEDISITHLTFGKEFAQAIEAKQVAHQEAERAKFVVMMSEQEKRAAVIKAEGEATAARLISQALSQGQALIELRKIEAAKEIAATLARSPNVVYLPKNVNTLLNLSQQSNQE